MIYADLLAAHKHQLGKVEARFTTADDADFKPQAGAAGGCRI